MKPETEIRYLKRNLARSIKDFFAAKNDCKYLLERALKAESELKEWKNRFDVLIANLPPAVAR